MSQPLLVRVRSAALFVMGSTSILRQQEVQIPSGPATRELLERSASPR